MAWGSSNRTADGTFTDITWGGGRGTISVVYAAGTGTVALTAKHPSASAAVAIKDAGGTAISFTANGIANVELPAGHLVGGTLASSSGADITIYAQSMNAGAS